MQIATKPRVLVVTYTYAPVMGGLPQQAHLLNRTLRNDGLSVCVVTAQVDGYPDFDILDNVPIYRLWTIRDSETRYRSRIYIWLLPLIVFLWVHRQEYDVIHVHQASYPAAVCVVVGKIFAKPVLIRITGSGASGNFAVLRRWWWLGSIVRWVLRYADCFVSLSDDITAELEAEGIPAVKIVHIHNGIDSALYTPSRRKIEANESGIVLGVGRFTEEKGFDILIKAWSPVISNFPSARLVIVGDGQDMAALKSLVRQLGIETSVLFEGSRNNVIDYLSQANIFVLPSRNEGMSNALLEAMSIGCACIASDIPANQGLLCHEKDGLLFKTCDPEDLSAKITQLLWDPQFCAKLGENARVKILSNYSISEKARVYVSIYSQLFLGEEPKLPPKDNC